MNKALAGRLVKIGVSIAKGVIVSGIVSSAGDALRSKGKDSNKQVNDGVAQIVNVLRNTTEKGYDIDDDYDF